MKGILGRKVGMTQVFDKDGKLTPVTVIEVEQNVVTQIKTKEKDGYESIQIAFGEKRAKLANKPELGHLKKANTTPKRFLKEIRGVDITTYNVGDAIKADVFEIGEVVDVTGTSKGKGFQGAIKRHNFSRGPMSHGSHFHRSPGSMGTMRAKRIFKGKKMPGHMGAETVTIQNLEIVAVDLEHNVILVKGNVPGPKKSLVLIKNAAKSPDVVKAREELISYIEELETTEVTEEKIEEVTEEVETTEEQEAETNEEKDAKHSEEADSKEEASEEEAA